MSRKLDDLSDKFRPLAMELIARAAEAGIPVMIIFTRRTQAEQDALYEQGRTTPGKIVTWTRQSKHVLGEAIDVCPYDQFQSNGPDKLAWSTTDPTWAKLGAIGESLGLKWGVVTKNGERIDLGHFEYVPPVSPPLRA